MLHIHNFNNYKTFYEYPPGKVFLKNLYLDNCTVATHYLLRLNFSRNLQGLDIFFLGILLWCSAYGITLPL